MVEHEAAVRRGRARGNQRRGKRFEAAIAKLFRELGFTVERTDERSGHTRGWDLVLVEAPHVVIQVKDTLRECDLLKGLNEARKHNAQATHWICIHRCRVKKVKGEYPISVAYTSRPEGPPSITDLRGFVHVFLATRGDFDA